MRELTRAVVTLHLCSALLETEGEHPVFYELKRRWNTKIKSLTKSLTLRNADILGSQQRSAHTQKSQVVETRLKRGWNAICTRKNHIVFKEGCEYRIARGKPWHPPPDKSIPGTPIFGWNGVLTLCSKLLAIDDDSVYGCVAPSLWLAFTAACYRWCWVRFVSSNWSAQQSIGSRPLIYIVSRSKARDDGDVAADAEFASCQASAALNNLHV